MRELLTTDRGVLKLKGEGAIAGHLSRNKRSPHLNDINRELLPTPRER